MTPWFLKLKTTGRGISVSRILAVTLPVLIGVVSGCAEKQYTILLHTFSGSNHVYNSKFCRDKANELAGWGGLELVHKNNNSDLYWGRYTSIPSANSDLKAARNWRASKADRPIFPFPKVVLIPGKEVEMPEYNLLNVSKGYWTVLVAIFVDDPSQNFVGRDRQKNALVYCDFLRKKGYEAYYHHTPGRSQVTVGTFPENAFVIASKTKPKSHILVPMRIVGRQVVRSAEMRKIMATADPPLRFLAVNGRMEYQKRRNKKTGEVVKVITSSYPIPIPGTSASYRSPRRGGEIESVAP